MTGSVLGLVGPVSLCCDKVRDRMIELQYLSQCGSTYNSLSRSFPEVHLHVAEMLFKQPRNYLSVNFSVFQLIHVYAFP